MLAPRFLPPEYGAWNRARGAPSGFRRARRRGLNRITHPKWGGPYAHQDNNSTRAFEYPWAWHAVPVRAGMSVIDIGGSLAGFQFTLAQAGAQVTNIDPGEQATGRGWPVDQESITRLNRAFGTDVRLVNMTLDAAGLEDASVDTAYSISTIEHIPPAELPNTMREIARVLRPGGHCVLTVDLFLNLCPFSDRNANEFGANVPPRMLVEESGLELVGGRRDQLLGYPEFDPKAILADLDQYMIGEYPSLAQCLVLRKTV